MVPIVAVPETKPPASPATRRPRLAPSARVAAYPTQPMPVMSTTSSQIRCGTRTPYGPTDPLGSSGSTMNAATKNFSASVRSRSVTVSRMKWWRASFETRTTTMETAAPAAKAGWEPASAPRAKVARSATSLVMPGSARREAAYEIAVSAATPTSSTPPRTVPSSDATYPSRPTMANVRTPALPVSALERSRSAPTSRPIASDSPAARQTSTSTRPASGLGAGSGQSRTAPGRRHWVTRSGVTRSGVTRSGVTRSG